jgi:5-methyltetrahydropteroyltriglutamate--homocysteine methyltransferase
MITARADVVGSLLRPQELLDAQEALSAGTISRADFKRIEDRAVDFCVQMQEDAGLEVVTDGEMRRLSFQSQLVQAVDGFGDWDIDAFLWGEWHGDADIGDKTTERPAELGVVAKLARRRHLSAEEFTYMRARTAKTVKVTLPSPSMFANLWSPELSRDAYPRLEDFLADVTRILREEVEELVRLGCTYIQIDAPHYPLLIDPKTRAFYNAQGWTVEQWLGLGLELDNALMRGIDPRVTFAFHLCRGNQGSRWLVEGGYDAIAVPIFKGIAAQRLMLEYDDDRSGDFTPLAEMPDDKTVVLGLVTTKHGGLETVDALTARIEDATRYIPEERLAISPQCGFATSIVGNALSIDEQRAKLELLCETAQRIWG